jgi:hypothetical protein
MLRMGGRLMFCFLGGPCPPTIPGRESPEFGMACEVQARIISLSTPALGELEAVARSATRCSTFRHCIVSVACHGIADFLGTVDNNCGLCLFSDAIMSIKIFKFGFGTSTCHSVPLPGSVCRHSVGMAAIDSFGTAGDRRNTFCQEASY